jgi:hypothetical protein
MPKLPKSPKLKNPEEHTMPNGEREELVNMLQTAAQRRPDEAEAEWKWLMERLALGPKHFLGLYEAVREGRWRTAKNPEAYLKAVARRQSARMDRPAKGDAELVLANDAAALNIEGEPATEGEKLDALQYERGRTEPLRKNDGIWRRSQPARQKGDGTSYREALLAGVPEEFKAEEEPSEEFKAVVEEINQSDEVHLELEPMEVPDWSKWAVAAGLSEWELRAVEYKLTGVSRERALAMQPDEASRRALQAAWRSLDRTGLERLKKAAGIEDEEWARPKYVPPKRLSRG